jgi:hypothetical protein
MSKDKKQKKASSKIVRAWFDTVINPLASGLSLVLSYLKDDDYTWNSTYQNFIEIKSIREFYDYKYQANYEQLVKTEYPELLAFTKEYDLKRNNFNDACIKLFEKLVASKNLQKLIYDIIDIYEKTAEISKDDAEYLRKIESINWIAAYLINNKNELPFNSIFRIIWNNEKVNFYNILNINGINDSNLEVKENRRLFEEITVKTLKSIQEFSNNLSLKYGEPIVI